MGSNPEPGRSGATSWRISGDSQAPSGAAAKTQGGGHEARGHWEETVSKQRPLRAKALRPKGQKNSRRRVDNRTSTGEAVGPRRAEDMGASWEKGSLLCLSGGPIRVTPLRGCAAAGLGQGQGEEAPVMTPLRRGAGAALPRGAGGARQAQRDRSTGRRGRGGQAAEWAEAWQQICRSPHASPQTPGHPRGSPLGHVCHSPIPGRRLVRHSCWSHAGQVRPEIPRAHSERWATVL